MKEAKQLAWVGVGVFLGLGCGVAAFFLLYSIASKQMPSTLTALLALGLGLGGMVGGGLIAMGITNRMLKIKRKQQAAHKAILKKQRRRRK